LGWLRPQVDLELVTLETHGHLIDGDLGAALDLTEELAEAERPDASAPQAAWSGS
jgi:hypothetical protein